MESHNTIYIGRKPVMTYVMAVMTAMREHDSEAVLMARGRAISTAVDVAEVVKNQFLSDLVVRDISIGTEELENEDGRIRNVSNIMITLAKE
jgi:DNA-binding protein